MVGRHDLDVGAEAGPERAQPLDRVRVRAFRRGENAPAVDEQLGETGVRAGVLGAGHRVRRHEMDAGGQVRRHVPSHGALDRADIGNDRARLQMARDLLRDCAAGADRDAKDDEIGIINGFRIGFHDGIGNAELLDAGCSRAARAIEPPISPKPISAILLNGGAALTGAPRSRAGPRPQGDWPLRCRWSCAVRGAGGNCSTPAARGRVW